MHIYTKHSLKREFSTFEDSKFNVSNLNTQQEMTLGHCLVHWNVHTSWAASGGVSTQWLEGQILAESYKRNAEIKFGIKFLKRIFFLLLSLFNPPPKHVVL